VRFFRRFSRSKADLDQLVDRCAVADRLVALRVAALARCSERHVAEPDSADAFAKLEAAEELLFLAENEQREARRDLARARDNGLFAPSPEDRAPRQESSPMPRSAGRR
jgi:hypothetical protein